MSKIIIKTIKDMIRHNKLSHRDMESIVEDYASLGLKKSEIRSILSLYESHVMKDIGILDRETSNEIKEKLIREFKLEDLIVKKNDNVNQTLKVGDKVYTFNVKEKMRPLKS